MDVTTTGKKEGMFKKLKQKLEENADGRIENASFSQERLPGSIVRTCSNNHDDQLIPVRTGQELIIGASDGQLYSFEATDNHLGCNSNPSTDSENVTTEEKLQWQAHQIQVDKLYNCLPCSNKVLLMHAAVMTSYHIWVKWGKDVM